MSTDYFEGSFRDQILTSVQGSLGSVQHTITPTIMSNLEAYYDRIKKNLKRCGNLIEYYRNLAGEGRGRRSIRKSDILRAAVVMMYASLEDFLKTIGETLIPLYIGQEGWEKLEILVDSDDEHTLKKGKISISHLNRLRGYTVQEVIDRSIDQWHKEYSFTKTSKISGYLNKLGIDDANIKQCYPVLKELLERRHRIAHRADMSDKTGTGHYIASSIKADDVASWLRETKKICHLVLKEVATL